MAEVTPLTLDDYEAIADAVQETERGRWFLAEYARRNRAADTAAVLDALAGLERRLSLQGPASPKVVGLVRQALDLALMARAAAPDEASKKLDELERTLRLAAEALGGSPAALVVEPSVIAQLEVPPVAPVQLALAAPVEPRPVILEFETPADPIEAPAELATPADEVATVEDAPILSPPIAHEEPEAAPEPLPARPATILDARPLLLDSLSEAEKAILFA